MTLSFILFSLFSLESAGQQGSNPARILTYQIEGKPHQMIEDRSRRLLISYSCRKPDGTYSCKAFQALKTSSIENIRNQLTGGKNPGAVLCDALIESDLVTGLSPDGLEFSFCLFKDGSLIDTGTLTFYSEKHDST